MRWTLHLAALAGCLTLSTVDFARAQPQSAAPSESRALSDLMSFFYKSPEPEKLVRLLHQWPRAESGKRWGAYPPLAGFLSVALLRYPDSVNRILPDAVDPPMRETLAAAARLSSNAALRGRIEQKIGRGTGDPRLQAEFSNLPHIVDLHVVSPTHLDIFWGAAFASGDPRFVRPIMNFAAETANRSEAIALDMARVALAMSGGPKDVYLEIKSRYDNRLLKEIVTASSALWALGSNARRHPFVQQALAAEAARRAGTPAGKALGSSLLRQTRPQQKNL